MNKRLLGLSIFALAFVMAFVFATPNASVAVKSNHYNEVYLGSTNLLGVDEAQNVLPGRDRDSAPALNFQSYGLMGDWEGQQ